MLCIPLMSCKHTGWECYKLLHKPSDDYAACIQYQRPKWPELRRTLEVEMV